MQTSRIGLDPATALGAYAAGAWNHRFRAMRILSQPPALGTGRHGLPGYGGAIWELTSRALTVAMMKVANSLAPHQPPDNYQQAG